MMAEGQHISGVGGGSQRKKEGTAQGKERSVLLHMAGVPCGLSKLMSSVTVLPQYHTYRR